MKKYLKKVTAQVLILCMFTCLLNIGFSKNKVQAASILNDNFEDQNSTGWTALSGNWSIVSDGSYVYKQSSTSGEAISFTGNTNWTDYSITIRVKLYDSNSTAASGVIARYKDNNNYYLLRLHQTGGLQLYKKSGGTFSLLANYSMPVNTNTAYTIKLVVNGNSLNGYVDDMSTPKITTTDSSPIAQGSIGLRTFSQTASYDDIQVENFNTTTPADIIIDNGDNGYTETGTWLGSSLSGYNGSTSRYSTSPNSIAKWSAYAPETGSYNVYVWYPSNNNTTDAKYTISSLNGTWVKDIDQTKNVNTWNKVATVSATKDSTLSVSLNTISGNTRADAVKYEFTSSVPDPITPIMPDPTATGVNIFVNQSGYDLDKPKRATVVNVNDGTQFYVKKANDNSTVFTGMVSNGIADFSSFNPSDIGEYYVQCSEVNSYNFSIGRYWMQKVSIGPALNFMNQSRQDTFDLGGNTGYGWRDSHQFSFELNSLVLQYMANPSAYDRMPYSIYSISNCEYPDLRIQNEPDIIWLMKFGAERYYDLKVNKGYDLHAEIKAQLPYFLYLYPDIKKYVSSDFYTKIRDFTVAQWSNPNCNLQWYDVGTSSDNNMFDTQSTIGDVKGQQPPGYSIIPNLLMYEVAKRDGLTNYQDYFNAAYNNCKWLIDNVDLNNPAYTKGQRMSEHITMEALAYFQEKYPTLAPAGLLDKINSWSDLMIKRSNNMWDLRKYADPNDGSGNLDQWTCSTTMNEVGNPAGFMAAAYAAKRVVSDTTRKTSLQQIGIAQIDDIFGRNPYNRCFFYNAVKEIEGSDKGWFTFLNGGYGDLQNVPGRLDGSPKEAAYPYNPNADYGYTEGWVAFNTDWNSSLAYSAADDLDISAFDFSFNNKISSTLPGNTIGIKLKAPLNFDYNKVETGNVVVTGSDGSVINLTVTEGSNNDYYFKALYTVPEGLSYIDISYGYGIFKKTTRININ